MTSEHLTVLTTLEDTRVFSLSIAVGRAVPPPPLEAKVDTLEVMTE